MLAADGRIWEAVDQLHAVEPASRIPACMVSDASPTGSEAAALAVRLATGARSSPVRRASATIVSISSRTLPLSRRENRLMAESTCRLASEVALWMTGTMSSWRSRPCCATLSAVRRDDAPTTANASPSPVITCRRVLVRVAGTASSRASMAPPITSWTTVWAAPGASRSPFRTFTISSRTRSRTR